MRGETVLEMLAQLFGHEDDSRERGVEGGGKPGPGAGGHQRPLLALIQPQALG